MNETTTFARQMVAVAPAVTRNMNLSTVRRQTAVISGWDAILIEN